MNKVYKRLFVLCVAGAMAFTGCSNDDQESFTKEAVRVKAVVSKLVTRSNTEEDGAVWDTNDRINVTSDGGINFADYEWSGTEWSSLAPLKWTAGTMIFAAYYPTINTAADLTLFTLAADQSTLEKLKKQDYMVAAASQQSQADANERIILNFSRKTARMIVKIAAFADGTVPTVSNVKIYSPYTSLVNGNCQGAVLEITPYDAGSGKGYMALVLPEETGKSNETFIKLTYNGEVLTLTGIPVMEAGYSYTYNLTINKGVFMFATVTVNEWNTAVFPGGTAVKVPENTIQAWE